MSKKAKEKKSESQMSLDFDRKAENDASHQSNNSSPSKIIYLDPRQDIYKKILDRK